MRITLNVDAEGSARAFLEAAVAGLVPTTAAGEAVVAALLAALDGRDTDAAPREPLSRGAQVTPAVVAAAHRDCGNIKATARYLGIARSTVRAHLARAVAPANGGARRAA